MDITQLPFNSLVGIERRESDGALLLPADRRYTNHLGTVHAGALMALAEAASGELLLNAFPELAEESVPVVRRFDAKFRKPANGAVTAAAVIDPDTRASFEDSFQRRGKASIDVAVTVKDSSGAEALIATVGWFVART